MSGLELFVASTIGDLIGGIVGVGIGTAIEHVVGRE